MNGVEVSATISVEDGASGVSVMEDGREHFVFFDY